jgi:hypothetical protein
MNILMSYSDQVTLSQESHQFDHQLSSSQTFRAKADA